MKPARLLSTTLAASLFLFSCGSADEKTTTEEATTTAESVSTETKAPETATTTNPSDVMLMQFKVTDYAKWHAKYESKERDSIRASYGLTSYVAGKGLDDPKKVIVILKMNDPNKAKELTASQGMKDRMKEAGIIGAPTFTYLDVVMDDNSTIPQTNRLMATHKVKDFDAWKKEFDSNKQMRVDNGLIDRALGYSVDDKKQVVIVFAVTNMAKAKAFIQSTNLKDIMEKAGVEGKPTFFYYNIEKMYQ